MSVDHAGWEQKKRCLSLADGRRLAYVHEASDTEPDRPLLVLLHGFTDSSRSHAELASLLRSDFSLLIPDLPGHGSSSARQSPGCDGFAEDIEALLDRLGRDRAVVLGHSMGGVVGIDLCARLGERAQGLVILASSLTPQLAEDSYISETIRSLADPIDPADPFFDEWHACARPVDPEFLAHARREAAAMQASVWQRVFTGLADADRTETAGRVTCPVFCLSGEDDPLFGPKHQRALADAFVSSASSTAVTLPGHGHNIHWEDAGRVALMVREFVSGASASGENTAPLAIS